MGSQDIVINAGLITAGYGISIGQASTVGTSNQRYNSGTISIINTKQILNNSGLISTFVDLAVFVTLSDGSFFRMTNTGTITANLVAISCGNGSVDTITNRG